MNVKGEHTFPATRPTTFALLTDPEVLKAVLPGCEEFTEVGEAAYRVVLTVNLIAFRIITRFVWVFGKAFTNETFDGVAIAPSSLRTCAINNSFNSSDSFSPCRN